MSAMWTELLGLQQRDQGTVSGSGGNGSRALALRQSFAARRACRQRTECSPSQRTEMPNLASQMRIAFSSMASNTGSRSPGELLMTLQHLRGRGLLLQRFGEIVGALAQLVEQPRVLDGDDGLGGEVLHQLDLLVGERPHLLAIDSDRADQVASSLSIGTASNGLARRQASSTGAGPDLCAAVVGDVDHLSCLRQRDPRPCPGVGTKRLALPLQLDVSSAGSVAHARRCGTHLPS